MSRSNNLPWSDQIVDLVAGDGCIYALISPGEDKAAPYIAALKPGAPTQRVETGKADIGNTIHGYGLPSLTAAGRKVLFASSGDGGVWRAGAGSAPALIAGGDGAFAFGDLACAGDRVFGVTERRHGAGRTSNAIASICSQSGSVEILFDLADFVSRPVIDPGCNRFAFLGWDLPYMPWERTSLFVGEISAGAASIRRVAAPAAALAQPLWGPDGALYVLCDAEGYFDIWRLDRDSLCFVVSAGADIGLSLAGQRGRSYVIERPGCALAVVWDKGVSGLASLNFESGRAAPVATSVPPDDLICAGGDGVFYAALPVSGAPEVRHLGADCPVLWKGQSSSDGKAAFPALMSIETSNADAVSANYYPADPAGALGIAVINLHGGPKSLAKQQLSPPLEALWRDGCDIVDLNYRGSAGFGRDFRGRINGAWGVIDVEDCIAAIDGLIEKGLARAGRIVLRGSSAGAFTLLHVLAKDSRLAGGVAYAAVTDLRALGRGTHKYESGYLKTLIGADNLTAPLFEQRSPISNVRNIRTPVLFLHGGNDAVSPVNGVMHMAGLLKDNGTRCETCILDGEGHNFSSSEALQTAHKAERQFIRSLMSTD
ncbi:MAG: hypothetical protein CMI63_17880 [Parvularcula sp.]|nr:hypothetical protein [Parvularcula sp.]